MIDHLKTHGITAESVRCENQEKRNDDALSDDTDSDLDEYIEHYGNSNDNLVDGNDFSGNVLLFL